MDILYDDIRSENVKYSEPFTFATIDILSVDIVFDDYSTKRKYHIEDKKSVNFRVFWELTYNKLYWELASDRNEIVDWLSGMK